MNEAAKTLAEVLRTNLKDIVLGPEYPVISRVQSYYFMTILIKVNRKDGESTRTKRIIQSSIDYLYTRIKKSQFRVYADVDPA